MQDEQILDGCTSEWLVKEGNSMQATGECRDELQGTDDNQNMFAFDVFHV